MKSILNKIFSKKFILSVMLTVVFATMLRIFYLQILHLNLSLDKIDLSNFSFCTIVALFKAIIHITLDECLTHSVTIMPDNDSTALCMDNKVDSSTSKQGGIGGSKQAGSSGSKQGGSSGSKQGGSSGSNEGGTNFAKEHNLSENMHSTLKGMLSTVHELENIKKTHKVSLVLSEQGTLSMDIPEGMPDHVATQITYKVSDLDIKYNTDAGRYESLLKLDEMLHKKSLSSNFSRSYHNIKERHKSLFEKE